MKNTVRLQQLIDIYLNRAMSEVEKAELLSYFDNPAFQAEIQERLGDEYDREPGTYEMTETQQQQLLQNVFQYSQNQSAPVKIWKLWSRIAVAAAITVMVFGAGLFYYTNQEQFKQAAYKNDIAPGKTGATLTLANGKKIRLSDVANGKLANEAGVVITKSADGQLIYELKGHQNGISKYNTLSTTKGETYQLRLPDGSLVWLNAASSLTYAIDLSGHGKRRVKLDGEGYFEIAKDKEHPFVVESKGQEVEVLGTHFNINSYSDEHAVITTLLEGSVKVTANKLQKILKPGQQSLNNGNTIQVGQANIENTIDWKGGDFYMDKVDFKTAMRKIARWYSVEVVYDASVPDNIETGGWISRNNKLSTVLRLIEKSGQVHFKLEGQKLYITK